MPGLSWDLWPALKAGLEFLRLPEIEAEWGKLNLKPVTAIGTANYRILTRMPIHRIEDLKGKKIRSLGLQAELLKALGGVPVGIVASEVFDALSRGTVDGAAAPPSFIIVFGFQNAAKYYSNLALGVGGAWPMAMNLNTWKKLPPDIQKVMQDVSEIHPDAFARIYQAEGDGESWEKMKAAGVRLIESPPGDLDKIKALAKGAIWEKWASERNKEGRPGTKVLNTWLELVEKYIPKSPYYKK
jgi:TRAP-type C4-dicarboxylate transport system substrate-binding protein